MSTDTRSSQAQRVSRTALDTERQGRLLHAARAHPSPGHAVQLASQAPPPLRYRPGASQPEMRRRRECGSSEVAGPRGGRAHLLDRRPGRHLSEHVGEALPALGRLDSPPLHIRSSQPPGTIRQPRRPAWRPDRGGCPSLFGGCPGRLLLAVRHPKVPRVPLRATLPLYGPHAHQRGARIRAQLAPTAARRHSSGRQPVHLAGGRAQEPRSKHGMALVAVQAPLLPPKDALLRGCSVTVIVAGAGLSVLRCGRGCGSRATWRYSLSTARGDGQLWAEPEYGAGAAF